MNLNRWITPVALAVFVVLIAAVFHYPVHIENALTLQPEPGFEVRVSGWRILFEPLVGPLLYFNQAFYTVEEFRQLLLGMVILWGVYTLIRAFGRSGWKSVMRFAGRQLVNLSILAGVWFVLLVLMIFIPLPNDKIVNKTSGWVLVTTHAHTEFSHDGMISQEGLLNWHQRNGFDAFFITDHNNHKQTLEFVNRRWNQEQSGEPVVFCGEEFSGSNHLSLLGLKSDFKTKGMSDSAVVAKARSEGAAILVNHWFDGERKSLEYYRDLGVDGFEIENTAENKRYNRQVYQRIRSFCENNGLILNGGLDFHGYGSSCTLWNAFEIPGWQNMEMQAKEEAILNILKTRDQSKLKVLLLNDRPYYEKKNLLGHTVITLVNYFRTLNLLQVVSWVFWIFLFVFLRNKLEVTRHFTCRKTLPLAGVAGALFLIGLGLVYVFRNQVVEDFTEIYPEYYRLLFMAGSALLVVSGLTAYFRIFRSKTGK